MPTLIDYKYADALTCFLRVGHQQGGHAGRVDDAPPALRQHVPALRLHRRGLGQGYCFTHMSKKY